MCGDNGGMQEMPKLYANNLDTLEVKHFDWYFDQQYIIYTSGSMPLQTFSVISNASITYHITNIHCTGDENILSDCEHSLISDIDCFKEAGVKCNSKCDS